MTDSAPSLSTQPAPPLRGRIELRLALGFWAATGVTAVACGAAGAYFPYAIPVLLLIAAWPAIRKHRLAPSVLDWLPLPLVILTYEMLHRVVPACWTSTIDGALRDADLALLGSDAGVLLERIVAEPLTLLMAAAYSTYYVLPVGVAVYWWRRNRRAFRELIVGETGALFIGYLGYLFLPAIGPHAYLPADHFGVPLSGDFIGDAIRSLNANHGGVFPRDAFPSLHTANAVTLILVAWRHERRVLGVVLPLALGIIAATIYLRFHYVVDVIAGAALAIAWQMLVPRLVAGESGLKPSTAAGESQPTGTADQRDSAA